MSKKRAHKATSKAADEFMEPHRTPTQKKILTGMKKLKVGGTFEQIAAASDLKPSQVWKRLSEMRDLNIIYECGYTRLLSSGVQGIVWQVQGLGYKNEDGIPVKVKKEIERKEKVVLPPVQKIKKQIDLF